MRSQVWHHSSPRLDYSALGIFGDKTDVALKGHSEAETDSVAVDGSYHGLSHIPRVELQRVGLETSPICRSVKHLGAL